MRNRDMPAHPVEGYEEVRWESDPPGGNLKSQRHDMKTGLTKREEAAIAAMQGILASPLYNGLLNGRGFTPKQAHAWVAETAVYQADALFDALEKPAPQAQDAKEEEGVAR